jgi:hypothetical protein
LDSTSGPLSDFEEGEQSYDSAANKLLMEPDRPPSEVTILVSNIGEKNGGVYRVNYVFFVFRSCRHTMQSHPFSELISIRWGD